MASRAYCCAVGGGPADVAALMVGRDRELSRVTRLLDDALAGQGRLVLCTGEAGIGKTRLGEELTAAAAARGVPVGWARAATGTARRRTDCGGWSWTSPPSAETPGADTHRTCGRMSSATPA